MKRAQIVGQVFILILASMVFILILLYGYKAISQFTQRSEQVAFVSFETDLKNAVKGVSLTFGSVRKVELTLPAKYSELCVFCSPEFDPSWEGCDNIASTEFQELQVKHPLLVEAWNGGNSAQNVFLVPLAETSLSIDRIEVATAGFCTPITGGRVMLKLTGKGDRALVEPWRQTAP